MLSLLLFVVESGDPSQFTPVQQGQFPNLSQMVLELA
jgi:hypothetical protein